MVVKYDEKSCGVVLLRKNDGEHLFLLLHYPSGHWDLPKGHVENNESEFQTAARELKEETGISDIKFIDGFRSEISYKYNRSGRISNKLVVFFLAVTEVDDVKISHEHHDFQWLPYPEAFNKVTFDNAKTILKAAKEFLEE